MEVRRCRCAGVATSVRKRRSTCSSEPTWMTCVGVGVWRCKDLKAWRSARPRLRGCGHISAHALSMCG
eukprot:357141-Chlamydomonas_euryale.AAC.9